MSIEEVAMWVTIGGTAASVVSMVISIIQARKARTSADQARAVHSDARERADIEFLVKLSQSIETSLDVCRKYTEDKSSRRLAGSTAGKDARVFRRLLESVKERADLFDGGAVEFTTKTTKKVSEFEKGDEHAHKAAEELWGLISAFSAQVMQIKRALATPQAAR